MGKLKGKRAVVTGASRGIGTGVALCLAEAGADVVITYRRKAEEAAEVARQLESKGVRAKAIRTEVTELEQVETAFKDAADFLGGIDTVVANAGVPSGFDTLENVEPKYWHKVVDTNLTGAFYTLRTAVGYLRKAGGGSIITMSSIAADQCSIGGTPYNAAKAGLNAITMTLAREVASENIRVNAISPGLIETDMGNMLLRIHGEVILDSIPLGRIGKPEEIGALAVLLASEEGSWITGKIMRIDGGAVVQP